MSDKYTWLLGCHDRTKHLPDRYAASPGYLDWETQPDPFRFYLNSPQLPLPLASGDSEHPYSALYHSALIRPEEFGLESISMLLELSLGLSAWKQYQGSRWSLRMSPSSGNLHPTECHLLLPTMDGIVSGISHYNPLLHCLEQRSKLPPEGCSALPMPQGFGLVLSSIYWREAWKYGERAIRYVNHDLGHAMAAIRYAANLMGWDVALQPQVSSAVLQRLLGFDQFDIPDAELEDADCLLWVSQQGDVSPSADKWVNSLEPPEYRDQPNRLSQSHRDWPFIHEAADLIRSPGFEPDGAATVPRPMTGESIYSAEEIIRKRRSAQGYDPEGSRMSLSSFTQIMQAVLPGAPCPFDLLGLKVNVSLVLFVHQVEGMEPGLYCLLRDPAHRDQLQGEMQAGFEWSQPVAGLPLYQLQRGDYRSQAQLISCQQAIAGDSAFSLAMLASFEAVLKESPWRYPSLYWETGMIGQVLYLEAEANGMQGTGIGCFYDDLMHELLGINGHSWQDLYHFTIGRALVDDRIQTLPPYHHLDAVRSGSN